MELFGFINYIIIFDFDFLAGKKESSVLAGIFHYYLLAEVLLIVVYFS